jgi:hypothetical protein
MASFAIGNTTHANGDFSITMGDGSVADGLASMSIGVDSYTNGDAAVAIGVETKATALAATAFGLGTVANISNQFVVGSYNEDEAALANPDSLLFVVANGSDPNNRHNVFNVVRSSKVGINTLTPDKELTVEGDARITGDIYYGILHEDSKYAKPDFVFKKDYNKSFDILSIEKFIKRNKHLPWITAAKNEHDGVNMTRMSFETLETVENQQLQIIELKKENIKQQKIIDELLKRIEKLEKKIK